MIMTVALIFFWPIGTAALCPRPCESRVKHSGLANKNSTSSSPLGEAKKVRVTVTVSLSQSPLAVIPPARKAPHKLAEAEASAVAVAASSGTKGPGGGEAGRGRERTGSTATLGAAAMDGDLVRDCSRTVSGRSHNAPRPFDWRSASRRGRLLLPPRSKGSVRLGRGNLETARSASRVEIELKDAVHCVER
jgi:hypothetical protein